jgi:hypothetical protein
MATQKPSKPSVSLPDNFGGIKTAYTATQIENGYQDGIPEVIDGGNINYEKDGIFQKLKYIEAIADVVNNIPVGKLLMVNSDNQFDYADASAKNSFGNIGDIQYTASTEVPLGGAWCDGALYTKAQFPDIYQMLVDGKIQSITVTDFDSKVSANGSCGFFALDTSNERFKVPLLKDVYLKAGQTPSIFGAESLPNITGDIIDVTGGRTLSSSGVFNLRNTYTYEIKAGSSARGGIIGFNASRSSSTYKNGVKVNPDHATYRAYVVLYSSAAEASVAQAAEFMTALGGKANADMNNITTSGKEFISAQGKPSNRYVDLTLGASGTTYTAPANGWFFLDKRATAQGQFIQFNNDSRYTLTIHASNPDSRLCLLYPILKNEKVIVVYDAKGRTNSFRFIYDEGVK